MKPPRSVRPPLLADRLLRWYCKNANIEDLHGDLEELFYIHRKQTSDLNARFTYWKNVLSLVFSYAVKKRKQTGAYHGFSSTQFNAAMFKNYFLIATRNLARNKFFTIINVLGLAIGMSISLLFIAMLSFLWRYDTFHENKNNIYRVTTLTDDLNQNQKLASAPPLLAEKLRNDFSGIDKIVRVNSSFTGQSAYEEKEIPLTGYFVDPEFLQVFTFPLAKGNPVAALSRPFTMLITEAASKKIFGNEDPLGKTVQMKGIGDFEITGILEDHPKNSHMHFEVLTSYQTLLSLKRGRNLETENDWRRFSNSYVYLLLPNKDTERIEEYLDDISHEVYANYKDFDASFGLQALLDIAPGEEMHDEIGPSWGYASLAIFGFLTLMILLPACFNYANISISRALKRMKEIGLRKVMGGQKDQIFFQFITETVVISMIAVIISFGIFQLIRKEFLMLIVGNDGLVLEPDVQTFTLFILFAGFVGLIAGIVPAMYFSKLTPIQSLKSKPVNTGFQNFTLRKILVVSQFALSLGFIMAVVIVLNQYRYTMNFDVGFNQENILDVSLQGTDPEIFRNEFSGLSSVHSVSMSSHVLGTSVAESVWVRNTAMSDSTEVFQMFVDNHFIPNFDLKMLSGNNFSGNAGNKNLVIVNEEFLKAFDISDHSSALQQTFPLRDKEEVIVIGVVKNFHYMHLMEPVRPFFFRYDPARFQVANVKVASTDIFGALTEMESIWKTFAGEKKFQAKFFEDEIAETYAIYFSMIKICGFLGFLAISISCLGLLGMVVFTVENRLKEIGIRKVMGASELNVTVLLSKHFIKLMLVAAVIAVPVTWLFFENAFLKMYYYKIDIGIVEIGTSILLMVFIGLTTILSQTVSAARANPVDILRSE